MTASTGWQTAREHVGKGAKVLRNKHLMCCLTVMVSAPGACIQAVRCGSWRAQWLASIYGGYQHPVHSLTEESILAFWLWEAMMSWMGKQLSSDHMLAISSATLSLAMPNLLPKALICNAS